MVATVHNYPLPMRSYSDSHNDRLVFMAFHYVKTCSYYGYASLFDYVFPLLLIDEPYNYCLALRSSCNHWVTCTGCSRVCDWLTIVVTSPPSSHRTCCLTFSGNMMNPLNAANAHSTTTSATSCAMPLAANPYHHRQQWHHLKSSHMQYRWPW